MDSCGNGHISKIIAIEDTAECNNILSQAKGNMPHVKQNKMKLTCIKLLKIKHVSKMRKL